MWEAKERTTNNSAFCLQLLGFFHWLFFGLLLDCSAFFCLETTLFSPISSCLSNTVSLQSNWAWLCLFEPLLLLCFGWSLLGWMILYLQKATLENSHQIDTVIHIGFRMVADLGLQPFDHAQNRGMLSSSKWHSEHYLMDVSNCLNWDCNFVWLLAAICLIWAGVSMQKFWVHGAAKFISVYFWHSTTSLRITQHWFVDIHIVESSIVLWDCGKLWWQGVSLHLRHLQKAFIG